MISKIYTNIVYRVFKKRLTGIPIMLRLNPLFSPSVHWYLVGKDARKEIEDAKKMAIAYAIYNVDETESDIADGGEQG